MILTLAGFAVWAARTTYQSVNNVQRLTTVNDAFQDARHAIAQENLAARRYQLRTTPFTSGSTTRRGRRWTPR